MVAHLAISISLSQHVIDLILICRGKQTVSDLPLVISIEQFSNDCNYALVIATLSDWLNNLVPVFQPMRSKTILVQYCRTDTTREWLDTARTTRTISTGRETMVHESYN